MALIAVQDVDLAGLVDPTLTAASGPGDTVENADERVYLYVENAAGVTRTITVNAQNPCNHGFTHDAVLTLLTTETGYLGPFDKERFNTASGLLSITYDSEAGVSLAALRLTKAP